jgi:predicted MFS family arabinose efflux permease
MGGGLNINVLDEKVNARRGDKLKRRKRDASSWMITWMGGAFIICGLIIGFFDDSLAEGLSFAALGLLVIVLVCLATRPDDS